MDLCERMQRRSERARPPLVARWTSAFGPGVPRPITTGRDGVLRRSVEGFALGAALRARSPAPSRDRRNDPVFGILDLRGARRLALPSAL